MNKRLLIPTTLAAGAIGFATTIPVAYGEPTEDPAMEGHQMEGHKMQGHKMETQSESAQSAIRDAWLHGKLETALLFNEHLNSFDIDTEVKNGTAYLSGAVESDIDRDLAGEIAKSISGVNDVQNELVVDEAKARTAREDDAAKERRGFKRDVLNATLTARIKSRLLVNDNTDGMDINVDSRDGVVTLSGTVDSEQEKELALQIAANTAGTNDVNDELTVEATEEAE